MKPNAENYNPDPAYLRSLIERAEVSQRKAARMIGIDERLLRSYLAKRESVSAREAPYPVQFCLECL